MDSEPPATSADIQPSNSRRYELLEKRIKYSLAILTACSVLFILVTGQLIFRYIEQPLIAWIAQIALLLLYTWMATTQLLFFWLLLLLEAQEKK
jgi:hypothetical protein